MSDWKLIVLEAIEITGSRIWCIFVGHDKRMSLWEDYCARCLMDWPQDAITVPVILNRVYCWAVDHGFPEWIDLWLSKHIKLPSWWEY